MIVVDAPTAAVVLVTDGPAPRMAVDSQLHVPHLIDDEAASGLRRGAASGRFTASDGWAALHAWQQIGITRHPLAPLLHRVSQLRESGSARDAAYGVLVESLGCITVTAEGRRSRAAGVPCIVTVVPR